MLSSKLHLQPRKADFKNEVGAFPRRYTEPLPKAIDSVCVAGEVRQKRKGPSGVVTE